MRMRNEYNRRDMLKTLGLSLGAASLGSPAGQAAPARRLKVGQTSINWGFKVESVEPGLRDSAKLGYWGYESYNDAVEPIEDNPGWGKLLEQYRIPMPSSYFNFVLTDPTVRKAQVEKAIRMGRILKKHGGITAVIGPNGVNRNTYDFKAAKDGLVATLNEVGQALADLGLNAALHQHTGTCVDTRDQVYAVLEARRYPRCEVRTGRRPVAEGWNRPRADPQGLLVPPAHDPPQGFRRRKGLGRLLSPRNG